MIQMLENLREVEAVEGWSQDKTVRWWRSPADAWQPATLVALDDYEDYGESGFSLMLATIPEYSDAKVQAAADLVQYELERQDKEVEPAIASPGGFTRRIGKPD